MPPRNPRKQRHQQGVGQILASGSPITNQHLLPSGVMMQQFPQYGQVQPASRIAANMPQHPHYGQPHSFSTTPANIQQAPPYGHQQPFAFTPINVQQGPPYGPPQTSSAAPNNLQQHYGQSQPFSTPPSNPQQLSQNGKPVQLPTDSVTALKQSGTGIVFGYTGVPHYGVWCQYITAPKHGWKDEDGLSVPIFSVRINHKKAFWSITGQSMSAMTRFREMEENIEKRFHIRVDSPHDKNLKFVVISLEVKPEFWGEIRSDSMLADILSLLRFFRAYKKAAELCHPHQRFEGLDVAFGKWLNATSDSLSPMGAMSITTPIQGGKRARSDSDQTPTSEVKRMKNHSRNSSRTVATTASEQKEPKYSFQSSAVASSGPINYPNGMTAPNSTMFAAPVSEWAASLPNEPADWAKLSDTDMNRYLVKTFCNKYTKAELLAELEERGVYTTD